MEISLNAETQKLLDQLLSSGKFVSAGTAIHQGLSLLLEEERDRVEALAELKAKLQRGVEQAERGELVTFDEVWRQIDELKRQRARTSA
jgi:Arc/MetJ-type ribon-helix-helix transcriptional regulator